MAIAPLPWRVDRESEGKMWTNSCTIVDANGGGVCHLTRGYQSEELDDPDGEPGEKTSEGCPSWDNAELIVAAVNAYKRS